MTDWSWFSFVVGGIVGLTAMWLATVIEQVRHEEETDRQRFR